MKRGWLSASRADRSGISLIEALVALAVMAIGMIGLVGIQASLRGNADVAKQRAEAVRLAQQDLERGRSYTDVTTPAAPSTRRAFADLVELPPGILPLALDIPGSAEFTLGRQVTDRAGPRHKAVAVEVTWTDRYAVPQRVRLASVVGGVPPELAATLILPTEGSPADSPGGRHRAVPDGAQPIVPGGSRSFLRPDPARTDVLRFDNLSGLVSLCNAALGSLLDEASVTGCTAPGLSVSGFLRFADPADATTPEQALTPTGPPEIGWTPSLARLPLGTLPPGQCAPLRAVAGSFQYFCVVPGTGGASTVNATLSWQPPAVLSLAPLPTSSGPDERRVCRYAGATYPLTGITRPLTNQNYLIIPAGAPLSVLNSCPADVTIQHMP